MSLANVLSSARDSGRCAFVAFVTAGDPSPTRLPELLLALQGEGTDIIELGAPFSEPVADGPTIQLSSQRALKKGMSLAKTFDALAAARRRGLYTPVVIFTYLNPVLAMGYERFAAQCARSGAQGALVVDLPADESAPLARALKARGLEIILLASPTTSGKRLAEIGRATGSILYYVSRAGVTGVRKGLAPGIKARLAEVRRKTGKPLIVGFGVAAADQARALAPSADGVVVGSALVSAAARGGAPAAAKLARAIARGLEL